MLILGRDNHALCVNECQFAWLICPGDGLWDRKSQLPSLAQVNREWEEEGQRCERTESRSLTSLSQCQSVSCAISRLKIIHLQRQHGALRRSGRLGQKKHWAA